MATMPAWPVARGAALAHDFFRILCSPRLRAYRPQTRDAGSAARQENLQALARGAQVARKTHLPSP